MVLTVSTADPSTYPGGHWETADNNAAEGTVVVSFNLVQAANGQAATAPTVSGSRAFAPWQYAGGANKAPWWAAEEAPMASVTLVVPNAAILGVANGVDPLLSVVPVLDAGVITQSSPFALYANTITVTFSCNVDLSNTDGTTIEINDFSGPTIGATLAFTEGTGFSVGGELGTVADYATDTLTYTVAAGKVLLASQTYVWSFDVTNPADNQAPTVSITVATTAINNDAAGVTQTINIVHASGSTLPDTAFKGVTNGLNGLKVVKPFEIRTIDDSIDTPLAPNVVTVNLMTNIKFVNPDVITITGLLLGGSDTVNLALSGDAAAKLGSSAVWDQSTGQLRLTVASPWFLAEQTTHTFQFTVANPQSTNSVPSFSIEVGSGYTPGVIVPLAMTQSAGNTDTVSVPFTIINPAFASLAFTPAVGPGAGSEIVFTFTPGDELVTTYANQGEVTFILPGFTGGVDNPILSSTDVTSNPADKFDRASFARLGSLSYITLTTKDGATNAFDAEVVVTVSLAMGVKIPADGVASNQADIKMSIGPFSYPDTWSEQFSATTIPAVSALITGVKVNALAAKGVSPSVATIPTFSVVELVIEELASVTSSVFATGDTISIRAGNAAWGCYATRADNSSTTRSADLALSLVAGATPVSLGASMDSSNLTATTPDGTTFTMCYRGSELPDSGTDSETDITFSVQDRVYSVQLQDTQGPETTRILQAPRNDFTVQIRGSSITATTHTASFIPDSEACPTDYDTARDLTHTGAEAVSTNDGGRNLVAWTWPNCKPLTTGVPRVIDSAECPTVGLYRMCYYTGSAAIETGISAYIHQVASIELVEAKKSYYPYYTGTASSSSEALGVDYVLEVKEPFSITVRLLDSDGNACCHGTKVFLSMTKHGADASAYLNKGSWPYSTANDDKVYTVNTDGLAYFNNYFISDTAGTKFYLTASVADATLNIPASGSSTVGFIVRPNKLRVQTTLNSEYMVGAGGDNAAVVLTTPIVVRAEDRYGNLLTGLATADDFHCEAMLETTGSGLDSFTNADWLGMRASVTSTDLTPSTSQNGNTNDIVFDAGIASFVDLKINSQAGLYFRLKFTLTEHAGSTGAAVTGVAASSSDSTESVNSPTSYTVPAYSAEFMISPAKMKVSWGATPTDYTASTFPLVTRSDGSAPTSPSDDAPNVDGLPSSLTITLLDADGAALSNAACANCVIARLVKCDDSTPTNGTTQGDGTTIDNGALLPACTGQAFDNSLEDQMAGMSQARCAVLEGPCTASTDWEATLSSSAAGQAGTTTDVVAGVATLASGLQARYTFGSGFLVRFIFDPYNATTEEAKSWHTANYGNIMLPDLGAGQGGSVTADHTSFVIRPYALEIAQNPGGDGVDLDGLASGAVVADGTVDTPDGVGAGVPFRVQPAIVVKGNGESGAYYYTSTWGNHGHMPITAAIKSATCGQDCVTKAAVLSSAGDTTVSLTSLSAASIVNDGTDIIATFSGSDPGTTDVEVAYQGVMGKVGFLWNDLKVETRDVDTGFESLKLTFVCGYNTNDLQAHVSASETPYTMVDSGYFDVFTAPLAPLSLKVVSYGELGFRVEFDPAEVVRLKPLSGFLVEVDFCTKSTTTSGSCALDPENTPAFPAFAPPSRALYSDYYTGGGRVEEVALSYSPTTPGQATEISMTIVAKEHIYGGDTLRVPLNLPGVFQAPDYSGTCNIEGAFASTLNMSFDSYNSAFSFTVVSTALLPRGSPITITLPVECEFIYPDSGLAFSSNDANLGASQTQASLADRQSSRYGTASLQPVSLVYAYVVGTNTSRFGDNCKDEGCTVSSIRVLPSIQDGNSMDLDWSGTLQYDATGTPCYQKIDVPFATSGIAFPSGRYCSMAGTGSNDPDAFDASAENSDNTYVTGNFGNSGQNGKPIGSNAGRAGRLTQFGTPRYVSTGVAATETTSSCRSGASSENPCVLPIGEVGNTAVNLIFTWSDSTTITSISASFKQDNFILSGSTIRVPFTSAVNAAGSTAVTCTVVDADGTSLGSWTCAWTQDDASSGTLSAVSGQQVYPNTLFRITTAETLSLTVPSSPEPAGIAYISVDTRRTSFLFRTGARHVTYTTADGDPVGSYSTSSSSVSIAAGDIVSFRVYAYNGRFKSPATSTPVQNRAIQKPASPAYFSEIEQTSVGVLLSYGDSTPGAVTNVTVTIIPPIDLVNGSYVDVRLYGFTSSSVLTNIDTGHDVFTYVQYNSNRSTLVLAVAPGKVGVTGTTYTVAVPSSAGIRYPSDGSVAPSSLVAYIASFTISWVTPFPGVATPRKGFVVQTTTDRNWETDIQSVIIADKLNNGVGDSLRIDFLQSSVTSSGLTLTLNDPGSSSPPLSWLVGQYIQIDSEKMRVEAVSGGTLTVIRGQLSTVAALHLAVKGGGTCDCDTAGTPSGTPDSGSACQCTAVYAIYPVATNPTVGRFDGFDNLIGTAGENPAVGSDGCKIGITYWGEGCNTNEVAYPGGIRSFQSATLSAGMAKNYWLSNCGTARPDVCNAGGLCACSSTTMLPAMDFGSPVQLTDELIYFRSTGEPFGWSKIPTTELRLDMTASSNMQSVVLADASQVAASYLRLDDEIIYVNVARSNGIRDVNLYQWTGNGDGGAQCVCSVTGVSSGGGTCACFPQGNMSGCTSGGTLIAIDQGGGTGFSAAFTVSGGLIDSITITDPGVRYVSSPALQIENGGDGCIFLPGQKFLAEISTEVVKVERGALGTTVSAHTSGTAVSKMNWPLRGTPEVPGAQYYFRIAAYNDAGLSNFVYFTHKIADMSPRELPTIGGLTVEITMEGAGTSPANTSVYIGHRLFNGSIDFERSKLCGTLTVADSAGTRLTCVTPPWVGKRHDLLVRYVSGIEERLSVGTSFVSYPAPILSSVSPVQVPAGQPAVVTISGVNFGLNQSDVVGALVTGLGEIRCNPLELVSDQSLICTLPVVTGVPFTGRFVVGVGTSWSGGQQNTTETGQKAKIKEYDLPAEATITIKKDINDIPLGSASRLQFEKDFIAEISTAAHIATWRIIIKSITAGSVVIVFIILPDPNSIVTPSPASAVADIVGQAAQPASELNSGALGQLIQGLSVSQDILDAAEQATGTQITTSDTPQYRKLSEPLSYGQLDMEKCLFTCRYECETGSEIIAIDGLPALASERPGACYSDCLMHCGFAQDLNTGMAAAANF